jgi:hypothetical protein
MVGMGVRDAGAAVRRQLWVVALVVGLVVVGAVARYAATAASRQQYTATQALVVQVLPPGGGGAYTAVVAQQLADRLERTLATGAPLAEPAFTRAVAAQVAQERDQVAARFGAGAAAALAHLDPRAVGSALTATQTDEQVMVTARWPTAAGAWALATAAGAALAADPGLALGALPASMDGASVRVVLHGAAATPALDPAPENAARVRLLETLLLGLAGGLALAYAVDRWPVWRRGPHEGRL